MKEELKKLARKYGAWLSEREGLLIFEATIAERRVFLQTQKLAYTAKIRIKDKEKVVDFSEVLREDSLGLSTGGDIDSGMTPGFGFKKELYNTFGGAREGTIEEQSLLFAKSYQYKFDYADIRNEVEKIAKEHGYHLAYSILPLR
ncbi:MAG: hypothetical protein WC451_01105 [Patescibacteria group bacterium]|jgi:hypothetical protein